MSSTAEDGNNGCFRIPPTSKTREMWTIASDGLGWEHVSVHATSKSKSAPRKKATPNWEEMCYIKGLFWGPEDVVVQFHPRESEYVRCHPHVLHLWRPTEGEIPTPDHTLVGSLPGETVVIVNGQPLITMTPAAEEREKERASK